MIVPCVVEILNVFFNSAFELWKAHWKIYKYNIQIWNQMFLAAICILFYVTILFILYFYTYCGILFDLTCSTFTLSSIVSFGGNESQKVKLLFLNCITTFISLLFILWHSTYMYGYGILKSCYKHKVVKVTLLQWFTHFCENVLVGNTMYSTEA